MSKAELERLCAGAEVLEQDAHGLKVLRLPDGDMLKLFRVKRAWSSARFLPYSKRFCRNAARLARRGVPTLRVKACYQLPSPGLTAVLYSPLPGQTLRQIGRSQGIDRQLLEKLGTFVASLHQRGIYFRSLHLGNIVLTPEAELGLIDIADLTIMPFSLFCRRRIRNFRHLCRLPEDRRQLGLDGWRLFCESYVQAMKTQDACGDDFVARAVNVFPVDQASLRVNSEN